MCRINGQGLTDLRLVNNISTAISKSSSATIKIADEDCKLAVEKLQESVKVCQSRSHCFHFPHSIIPYTHQPGKTFSLTASIFLNYCFKKISISVNPSLTSHTLCRERKGLVTLQPSSCHHGRELM